ncbi:hypothetical protein EJB05_17247 [Eragrostis curvula]|uniref:Survival protein SurE-like phosphatase/nucleotidase domain-containing protein n=1 Tax=Eragrostis curvula TaxID=38414 RepID=A0A5J9VII5_9POAL|nr:hypothetical protein EJB05_17247 [Eragrostis curvula]
MAESSGNDAPKRNPLPAALVSNLQSVLAARRPTPAEDVGTTTAAETEAPAAEASDAPAGDGAPARPVVLLTCAEGIRSAGLTALVDALVAGGRCDVHVCAPDSDKPACGHSITIRETITATSYEFTGAKAFEISGTPVDCVSLALSGRLFSWSAPALVISGISAGSNCGYEMFHSSAIAAAREALMYGVPSIAISLNWKKDESKDSDFKDAAQVCLPLINAALADIEKELSSEVKSIAGPYYCYSLAQYSYNLNCMDHTLNELAIAHCSKALVNASPDSSQGWSCHLPGLPPRLSQLEPTVHHTVLLTPPWAAVTKGSAQRHRCCSTRGFKLTKQSVHSPAQSWQAVSSSRPSSAAHFMGMHQSLGIQLAQLGKDASAAGAARRVNAQRKLVEVESVASAGKQEVREVVKKLFRAELVEKEQEGLDEDIDLRALENGFISITPVNVNGHLDPEIGATASNWLSAVVSPDKENPPAVGDQQDAPPADEENEVPSAT